MNQLEELLGHRSFVSLEKHDTHWTVNHISFDGVSRAALCATNLNQVLQDFENVAKAIDAYRDGNISDEHVHDWHRSMDGSTEVCRCGAWR